MHYYFVPYRLLWDDWEDFITGGVDGQDASVVPRWTPTNTALNSLWDYFGFPVGISPTGALPLDFPRRAYNMVYNEYYRDENLQLEVALTNESILRRNWPKDYLTSALPWQQRGISPALPIVGTTHAIWPDSQFVATMASGNVRISTMAPDIHFTGPDIAQGRVNLRDAFNNNTVDLSSVS